MKINNWREFAFLFVIIGMIQYLIFTTVAMFFYTGGTLVDSSTRGYSFFSNFFSDLGRTRALSGKSNLTSYLIFTISGSIMGVSLIPFSIAIPHFFKDTNRDKRLSIIGSIFAILTSILMLIVVILLPWDIYYYEHILVVMLYALTGLVAVILFSIVLYSNKEYPNQYAYVLMAYAILFIIYTVVLFIGPDMTTPDGLIFQATTQKIMTYVFIVCFVIQGYGALQFEKTFS